jgi:hypothetical protein
MRATLSHWSVFMAIIREPKPLPSPLNYVPPDSRPYKVMPDDNWWTLAERSDGKFSSMSAVDSLSYFRRVCNWW